MDEDIAVRRLTKPSMATLGEKRCDARVAKSGSRIDACRPLVDSVVVTEDGEFAASFGAIATLALANKLPSIGAREYAEAGGLIGYGADILGLYRRAAYFVDRILKGV